MTWSNKTRCSGPRGSISVGFKRHWRGVADPGSLAVTMNARLREWIVPLIGISLISTAIVFEWLFNRLGVFVKYKTASGIIFDDIHGIQIDFALFQAYGPSPYSGGFTDIGTE